MAWFDVISHARLFLFFTDQARGTPGIMGVQKIFSLQNLPN